MSKENNGWISVEERLPELDSVVWGGWFYKDKFQMGLFERSFIDGDGQWLWSRTTLDGESYSDDEYPITHWQPLPKPPIK